MVPGLGVDGTLRGMERVASTLVKGLEAAVRYAPHVCVLRAPDPVDARHGLSAPMTFLGYEGKDQDWQMAAACAPGLRRLLREVRPDVVHSHLWPTAFAVGLAQLGLGIAHVIHIHDQRAWLASPRLRHRLRRLSQRIVLRLGRPRFIACSKATGNYALKHLGIKPAGLTVIASGIDSLPYAAIPQRTVAAAGQPVVFGLAGTLAPEKGVGELLRACAALRDTPAPFRLRIAGEGTARPTFEQEANRLGLRDRVEFLGAVRDMASFYASLDVFVLPSLGEGLPVSVLEAMAAGRPVVASALSGIPEAVRHGVEGLLVPPGDVPALSAALGQVISDPALRLEMGRRARARALRDFTVDRMVDAVAEVYDRMLGVRDRS